MIDNEDVTSFSIGAVYGDYDPYNKAWMSPIRDLVRLVKAAREGVESPLAVNVVFHVDGKLAPNEFVGVRTGRFRRDKASGEALLMVQAAVPLGEFDSRKAVLIGLLREATLEAEKYARKRGIADGLPELRELVERVAVTWTAAQDL